MNLLRLGAASLAFFAAAATATAEPPAWVVSDNDSRMVLFPTIHILPADLDWDRTILDRELAAAEEVWFEAEFRAEGEAELMALTTRLGFDPANPLSDRLPGDLHARAVEAAESLGIPGPAIEPMQTWMLALTLSVLAITNAGFDPESGVEKVLEHDLNGREPRFLETPEEQLSFFADMEEGVQQRFLDYTVAELAAVEEAITALVADWAAGSVEGLTQEFIVEMRDKTPEVYEVLILQRNAEWVETLRTELEGEGTDFVAVGAAHLVGEDGLPKLFESLGYKVERL